MRSIRSALRREAGSAALSALLIVPRAAFAQNAVDLEDARNAAHTIVQAAEERFDCELQERSMREIGNEQDAWYLVYVRAEGDECRDALVFATNAAAKDDRLLFRELESGSEALDDPVILFSAPVIGGDQVLIHEVNPDIDEYEQGEE